MTGRSGKWTTANCSWNRPAWTRISAPRLNWPTAAAERGLLAGPLSQSEWLDLVMAEIIQPALPGEQFTILYDYPPEQAALSRIRADDPPVAERFEVFLGQSELANGYQELTDAEEQLRRFRRESRLRQQQGQDEVPT